MAPPARPPQVSNVRFVDAQLGVERVDVLEEPPEGPLRVPGLCVYRGGGGFRFEVVVVVDSRTYMHTHYRTIEPHHTTTDRQAKWTDLQADELARVLGHLEPLVPLRVFLALHHDLGFAVVICVVVVDGSWVLCGCAFALF